MTRNKLAALKIFLFTIFLTSKFVEGEILNVIPIEKTTNAENELIDLQNIVISITNFFTTQKTPDFFASGEKEPKKLFSEAEFSLIDGAAQFAEGEIKSFAKNVEFFAKQIDALELFSNVLGKSQLSILTYQKNTKIDEIGPKSGEKTDAIFQFAFDFAIKKAESERINFSECESKIGNALSEKEKQKCLEVIENKFAAFFRDVCEIADIVRILGEAAEYENHFALIFAKLKSIVKKVERVENKFDQKLQFSIYASNFDRKIGELKMLIEKFFDKFKEEDAKVGKSKDENIRDFLSVIKNSIDNVDEIRKQTTNKNARLSDENSLEKVQNWLWTLKTATEKIADADRQKIMRIYGEISQIVNKAGEILPIFEQFIKELSKEIGKIVSQISEKAVQKSEGFYNIVKNPRPKKQDENEKAEAVYKILEQIVAAKESIDQTILQIHVNFKTDLMCKFENSIESVNKFEEEEKCEKICEVTIQNLVSIENSSEKEMLSFSTARICFQNSVDENCQNLLLIKKGDFGKNCVAIKKDDVFLPGKLWGKSLTRKFTAESRSAEKKKSEKFFFASVDDLNLEEQETCFANLFSQQFGDEGENEEIVI